MQPYKEEYYKSKKPFSSNDIIDAYELNYAKKPLDIKKDLELITNSQMIKTHNRHEKFQYEKYLKKPKEINRTDPFVQNGIRKKFVETAKKYIGIPYNRKYLHPSHPNYDSHLFLDCCGLVRQVVQDLKDDFGFILGPWNQAYQFDTLPNEIEFEEMKPGDLIFYSGRYHDRKRRRNGHDMVHVEIFLGGETGFQTIAARRKEGVVEIFDDFRFRSSIYYNVKHYFKSIDTWLQGICKSYCSKHNWIENDMWWSEKYSFYVDDNEEEKEIEASAFDQMANIGKEMRKVYIGKGNNYKLIKSFFNNNEKWVIMSRYQNLSTDYYFKWVPCIHEIDFAAFQEGKQIVNHIPNSKIISSKLGLITLLREHESHTKNPISNIHSIHFLPKSYIMDNVEDQQLFFQDILDGIWIYKPMNLYRNKRVRLISDTEKFKQDFIEKQKILNFNLNENLPIFILKKKTLSAGNQNLISKRSNKFSLRQKPVDNKVTLLQNINNLKIPQQKTSIKLPIITRGFSNSKRVSQFQTSKMQMSKENDEPTKDYVFKYKCLSSKAIFQKYIEKPFLYENRKCELRCFVLIASTKPFLILFHHGYLKLSLDKYKLDKDVEDKKKKFMHLVNSHIQKKHPNFVKEKEKTSLNMDSFEKYLQETKKMSLLEIESVYLKVKKILTYVFTIASRKLERKKGYFELYGCDFIFDENLNPFLMDISSNPSLLIETNTHLETIPLLIKKALEIVILINESKEEKDSKKNIEDLQVSSKFEILYQENK